MDDLREILQFVTSEIRMQPAVFQTMLFGREDQKQSRLMTFLQQQELDDEEAIKTMYGNTEDTGKYRVLKKRLKDRLLNLIFLSDNNLAFKNPYPRAYFRLNRNILAGKFFLLKDKRRLGIALLKQALNTALGMELSQEAVECCMLLCYHFAYTGNEKELAAFQKINNAQQRILQHERTIEALYDSTLSRQITMAGYDSKSRTALKKNFEKAQRIYRRCSSFKTKLMYHRVAYYYYHSRSQYRQVIKTCSSFISYLDKNTRMPGVTRYGEFSLYIMESCIRLRDFDAAKAFAAKCEKHYTRNSTPWLQFREYCFLVAMHTGNITRALKIHHTITSGATFSQLPSFQKERWRIFEAYLNFALPEELPKKQFRLFRFLNQVELSNHDKPGYNFSILLAQIILLINIGDWDKLLDVKLAFRDYFRRYINKIEQPRCFYFGCMMIQLFKNDFNFKNADKGTRHFIKNLKGTNFTLNPVAETEVIPYETLWEMLRKKL